MRERGQFAIEMFFAFTFAILLVFWMVNYLELFSTTTERVPLEMSQKLIARDIGKIANEVCVNGGTPAVGEKGLRISIDAPCLQLKDQSWYYSLGVDGDGKTLLIWSDSTNSTSRYTTSCNLETNTNLTRCAFYQKICIYKLNEAGTQKVMIETGECG